MTAVPARDTGRRRRRLAVIGAVLVLPRLVLAWLPGLDALQILGSLALLAGLALLGVALLRTLIARDPRRRMWPIASAGITGVLVAGWLTTSLRPTAVTAAGDGPVPAPVVLYQYGWTLVGAAWAIGLVLIAGSIAEALRRGRRSR